MTWNGLLTRLPCPFTLGTATGTWPATPAVTHGDVLRGDPPTAHCHPRAYAPQERVDVLGWTILPVLRFGRGWRWRTFLTARRITWPPPERWVVTLPYRRWWTFGYATRFLPFVPDSGAELQTRRAMRANRT